MAKGDGSSGRGVGGPRLKGSGDSQAPSTARIMYPTDADPGRRGVRRTELGKIRSGVAKLRRGRPKVL